MYIDLEEQSKLQPYVQFDWRLIAERGLRCYGHFHNAKQKLKTVASCEINFLLKTSNEENGYPFYHQGESCSKQPRTAILTSTSATQRAGQFKCVGAIRKAGFLSVKKWILKRKQSIELARKQGWKRYWVCLRGTTLLFHSLIDKHDSLLLNGEDKVKTIEDRTDLVTWIQANCPGQLETIVNLIENTDQTNSSPPSDRKHIRENVLKNMSQCFIEKEPRHLIIIEDAIAQPIPEHPKRDFVFCLSTTFGDAYLFQSSCQLESENWILAIHNACAASIARDLTRDEATKLFETKIRHLELEAEKKLFLRQRLESRLTSMSSISNISNLSANIQDQQQNLSTKQNEDIVNGNNENSKVQNKNITMRSLLLRLNQQLLALDTYIEQVHCEVYQLRCYLSSCESQHIFYQNVQSQGGASTQLSHSIDLPHPRSLLMHVSKPTKLQLIRLGVFTVSSFHAYTHARQGKADIILQRIHQRSISSQPLELRIRSQSISEALLSKSRKQNVRLESDSEELIHISNLRAIKVRINRKLFNEIRQVEDPNQASASIKCADSSDDRYSILDEGEFVIINLKLHFNSTSIEIIEQVLNIIEPNSVRLKFLDYYLIYNTKERIGSPMIEDGHKSPKTQYATKRKETLNDWTNLDYMELVEKIVFRLELNRKQMDEEAMPFGISVGAQLFVYDDESILNVYCNYIEWGGVADKAGLKDDDELLTINGVPVMDLDMMFVECLMQDENTLRLLIRSSRSENPSGTTLIDKSTWQPSTDHDGDGTLDENHHGAAHKKPADFQQQLHVYGSQIISDEYISTLVCPPPPTHSKAFLRTDSNLLRQKSDFSVESQRLSNSNKNIASSGVINGRLATSATIPSLTGIGSLLSETKIQQKLECSPIDVDDDHLSHDSKNPAVKSLKIGSDGLANQLIKETEQLTNLLGTSSIQSWRDTSEDREMSSYDKSVVTINSRQESESKSDLNLVERLKKSTLELLETEYAYIRHLDTINEHYMIPLEKVAYLSIPSLKYLSRIIIELTSFQKGFFDKLTKSISVRCKLENFAKHSDREFDELNEIVQHLDLFTTIDDFTHLLKSLSKTFLDEAEKFKIYSAYCAAYSSLQKLLHPKGTYGPYHSAAPTSIPNTLDTFLASNSFGISTTTINKSTSSQHLEFLKPLGSFITSNAHSQLPESSMQLKQLGEFLGHLDSSSSSAASLSLPKSSSSNSEHTQNSGAGSKKSSSSKVQTASSFHKNVHQQNFESYLIKPIQRIVKYPMLLNSIAISAQAYTNKDIEVYQELKKAVREMESITVHVNDVQRINDEYGLIFSHIERQFVDQKVTDPMLRQPTSNTTTSVTSIGPHQPPINLGIEELLYFGTVDWLNINEFTSKLKKGMNLTQVLFVFNSCVVFICKEQLRSTASKRKLKSSVTTKYSGHTKTSLSNQQRSGHGILPLSSSKMTFLKATNNENFHEVIRYQSIIPVSEVQVRSVPVSSSESTASTNYRWELFRCSSVNSNSSLLTKSSRRNSTGGKVYLLATRSNESRNAFLRKIRFIIRESVRNMSLPMPKSPPSKSLTPKKLSSPSSIGGTNTNSSCSHSTSLSPVCNSGERCNKGDTKEESLACSRFTEQVNNNFKTSIEVNN